MKLEKLRGKSVHFDQIQRACGAAAEKGNPAMWNVFPRCLLTCLPVLSLSALGLLAPCQCLAQSGAVYTIATAAGSGIGAGYAGDGGLATDAMLNLPASVALDGSGNLYICDWSATIRKVNARTGVITTVAGTGAWGYAGDGGLAINALLGGPGDLAADPAGNIYFADGYNNRLRRISVQSGTIETIAGNGSPYENGDGGLAVEAGVGYVSAVAVDKAGNIYFTNGGDRVRKVAAGTGVITTIAGGHGSRYGGDGGPATLAQISQPSGLAFDAQGNLYIAARGEQRIRKVNAHTGIISTIAGVSDGFDSGIMGIMAYPGGYSGDGGPAANATLNDPACIALDSAGNIYISDVMNYRVRRIDAATGIIDTIAGTGAEGYSGDIGLALKAQISTPSGIAANKEGWIYFGDQYNQRVRVLRPLHESARVPPKDVHRAQQ